jgi:uncharacterized repeat protein (TIGR01451 family)
LRRYGRTARRLSTTTLVVGLAAGTALLPAGAAFAAPTPTTLIVTLGAQPRPPMPGKSVTYTATIRNSGTVAARGVQLELSTSLGLADVKYHVSSGRCYRSATKTVCLIGVVTAGSSANAQVTGVLPKGAPLYSTVDVHATVTSSTPLTTPAASDLLYPLGGQSPVPLTSSLPAVTVAAPGSEPVSWLESTPRTRTLAIGFAVLVVALIVAARWWERRRSPRPAGTPPTVPGPAGESDPADERIGV